MIYTFHDRGFALISTRSPEVQRLHFQCDSDEDVANWPDDRIWEELKTRLATEERDWTLSEGKIFQKNIVQMRSIVVEPMQYGKPFLAGDAAYILPLTGAKGMNLAITDISVLARAFNEVYSSGRPDLWTRTPKHASAASGMRSGSPGGRPPCCTASKRMTSCSTGCNSPS